MENNHINYIEFKAIDLKETRAFYEKVFDWTFTEYGPTYIAFEDSGVAGGFERTEEPIRNGVLVVLYHKDLTLIQTKITAAGGEIVVPTFSFPGGQRFQFKDPSGNELAVWSE